MDTCSTKQFKLCASIGRVRCRGGDMFHEQLSRRLMSPVVESCGKFTEWVWKPKLSACISRHLTRMRRSREISPCPRGWKLSSGMFFLSEYMYKMGDFFSKPFRTCKNLRNKKISINKYRSISWWVNWIISLNLENIKLVLTFIQKSIEIYKRCGKVRGHSVAYI